MSIQVYRIERRKRGCWELEQQSAPPVNIDIKPHIRFNSNSDPDPVFRYGSQGRKKYILSCMPFGLIYMKNEGLPVVTRADV